MAEDTNEEQYVEAPKSTDSVEVTQLGYINSYDVPIEKNYAFVIYKETNSGTGKTVVKIKSKWTAGCTIDPENPSFKKRLVDAVEKGEAFFIWGFQMSSPDNDPRVVETRIYPDENKQPAYIEHHLVTRNADGSAKEEQVLKVDWPV